MRQMILMVVAAFSLCGPRGADAYPGNTPRQHTDLYFHRVVMAEIHQSSRLSRR